MFLNLVTHRILLRQSSQRIALKILSPSSPSSNFSDLACGQGVWMLAEVFPNSYVVLILRHCVVCEKRVIGELIQRFTTLYLVLLSSEKKLMTFVLF